MRIAFNPVPPTRVADARAVGALCCTARRGGRTAGRLAWFAVRPSLKSRLPAPSLTKPAGVTLRTRPAPAVRVLHAAMDVGEAPAASLPRHPTRTHRRVNVNVLPPSVSALRRISRFRVQSSDRSSEGALHKGHPREGAQDGLRDGLFPDMNCPWHKTSLGRTYRGQSIDIWIHAGRFRMAYHSCTQSSTPGP